MRLEVGEVSSLVWVKRGSHEPPHPHPSLGPLPFGICLAVLFNFRHFVGNVVANFVENLAEFDGLFSNINCVDKVRDEVSDEGTKG